MVKAKDTALKKISYDETVLICHPFARKWGGCCLKTWAELLKREGYSQQTLFKQEKAIDLDDVEKRLAVRKSGKECTVDFVTGLSDKTLLMIEAKLNVKAALNISATEIRLKIEHSRDLLMQDCFTRVAVPVIVLFNDNVCSRAKNELKRKFAANPNIIIASVNDLHKRFF